MNDKIEHKMNTYFSQSTRPKLLDLFAGAGGFSEGFSRLGFDVVAHVEMDRDACNTLRTRIAHHKLHQTIEGRELYGWYLEGKIRREELYDLAKTNLHPTVIEKEICLQHLPEIFELIDQQVGNSKIDIVVGGPPCQAYSLVGRARDPYAMKRDERNYLFRYYAQFLERYQPKYFIFENVLGLLSAGGGQYFEEMKSLFSTIGYALDWKILDAQHFGVIQHRKRIFLVGKKTSASFQFEWPRASTHHFEIMRDLFADLPLPILSYMDKTLSYANSPTEYLLRFGIRGEYPFLTQHFIRRVHPRDSEIYRLAAEALHIHGQRIRYTELPTRLTTHANRSTFLDRFKVVHAQGKSHTLVAHISKDGHHYIHPDSTQKRSLTIREAARIQSFPDDYFFEGSRTAAYKQIGNAVPPLMAEAIARALLACLDWPA